MNVTFPKCSLIIHNSYGYYLCRLVSISKFSTMSIQIEKISDQVLLRKWWMVERYASEQNKMECIQNMKVDWMERVWHEIHQQNNKNKGNLCCWCAKHNTGFNLNEFTVLRLQNNTRLWTSWLPSSLPLVPLYCTECGRLKHISSARSVFRWALHIVKGSDFFGHFLPSLETHWAV